MSLVHALHLTSVAPLRTATRAPACRQLPRCSQLQQTHQQRVLGDNSMRHPRIPNPREVMYGDSAEPLNRVGRRMVEPISPCTI